MNIVAEKQREVEQQNLLLEAINALLEDAVKKFQNLPQNHEKNELKQQNMLLEQINSFILDNNQKSIESIFSIVSHELRTPLAPIKAYSKMILDGKFGSINQDQMAKLSTICQNVSTLEQIIQSSIDSKKIETGLLSPKLEKCDIVSIMEDARKQLEDQINEKNITFSVPAKRHFITCDHDLMKRMLVEIIKNSIVAVPKGGNIMLSVEQLDGKTQIKISDNGCGIPKNKITGLFSKLYQIDQSNTREKSGLGVGLFFCKQIVEAHNGTISIHSEGQGTTVSITLKT
ncbi:MAG: sensor histidine kinase [Nitrososphaeria archaeon]|nr:sensor histidine kinase [Nitrososphaeria archaeon]NDB88368.1 sensor histidine kinase [Nitrososphaerota archaeon]NDF27249.1 sensor histidine kinase [Nitrosopumilaceae archaeon]NDB46913.1 sensor histidine kinase [Nitrososphaeria archaeon]NDB90308.1 sensor histidine kinase [Nitrososphaerota archaeon]